MKYAEVILPLPLARIFTYSIPDEMIPFVRNYCLVTVPFGSKRTYTAIVKAIHDRRPDSSFECKEISAVLVDSPVIFPIQMRFWEWITSYYLCNTGDVYKAALPPGFLVNDNKKHYTPPKEVFIRLTTVCNDEDVLNALFSSLKRAKQQERMLLAFAELSKPFQPELTREISRKELLKVNGMHASVLDGLIKRGILETYEKESSQIQLYSDNNCELTVLTEAQQTALYEIQAVFKTKSVCLLHGISACGKTEIYTHLIHDTLQQGHHVLYLLPEIAVTDKITERLSRVFGSKLLVCHSGLSDNKRIEVWNRLLHAGESMLVVGVRSSIFLPFENIGLVIVDDEHDTSYRQQDPTPRYHARNAAIMLAHLHGARTLLGSATPSLESYYNAGSKKYGFVSMKTRYGNAPDPQILIANIKDLKRRKMMKDSLFSPILKEKMEDALKRDEQIVIFQNRRGFTLVMECKSCGHVVRCMNCDVSLTCHKQTNRLVCHYCGYSVAIQAVCPSCGGKEMKAAGFGTEKVEEEIATLFPDVRSSRLDFDTARTRGAFQRILNSFELGKSKILIGTQMLTKGLDTKQVSVVGVLNADSLMNVPDFRSHERAFQLMMQISRLACRSNQQGTVVIQTSQPEHALIQAVKEFDYKRMAIEQLNERKTFGYPPYFRLIVLVFRSGNEKILEQITARYAELLQAELEERVIPPFAPPVNRLQALHVRHIMLKIETNLPVPHIRGILDKVFSQMKSFAGFSKVDLHYEVDN